MRDAYQDFAKEFAEILVPYDHFFTVIRRFVQLFIETDSVDCMVDLRLETKRMSKPLGNC